MGGLRFQVDKDLSLGLSVSSPTWFQTYSWNVTDPSGAAVPSATSGAA